VNTSETVAGQIQLEFRDISHVSEAIGLTAKRMSAPVPQAYGYVAPPIRMAWLPCHFWKWFGKPVICCTIFYQLKLQYLI